jgi:hypothetical protein
VIRRLAAVLILLAPLLSACTGDPVSAFQHEEPFSNPLLDPGLRGGINVPPVEGLPPTATDTRADDTGADLAGAVAQAMRNAEIAASEAPPVNGRFALLGRSEPESDAAGKIAVTWTLVDDNGEVVRHFVTQRQGDPDGKWIQAMAGEVVAAVNRYVMESEGLPPPPEEMPKLTIVAIDGAPGAGGRALASSLEYHLEQAGFTVSDKVEDHGALILGQVSLTPSKVPGAATSRDTLALSWTVLRPNGSEIGTIEQANDIPKGTLDGPWGDLAYIIAQGAAEGIVDLLRKTAGHPAAAAGKPTVAARNGGRAGSRAPGR